MKVIHISQVSTTGRNEKEESKKMEEIINQTNQFQTNQPYDIIADQQYTMTSAQVCQTSVTNNSSFQNYPHPDDHTIRTTPCIIYSPNLHILTECRTFTFLTQISQL